MSLFAIADTHLSLSADKPMDIFNGWSFYVQRLEKNWRAVVSDGDTVVIPGDVSWAMSRLASRQKNTHEGQSRLLVEHHPENGKFFQRKGL